VAPIPLLPRAAVRFGFLGLAPLVVSGLVTLSDNAPVARFGALSFTIYGAALLSFLGGVRCGIEIRNAAPPNPLRLLYSALPALFGWALALYVVISGTLGAACIFAGLFAAQNVWDHGSARTGAPDWYPLLRQVLTGGAMIACMLLPMATLLGRI